VSLRKKNGALKAKQAIIDKVTTQIDNSTNPHAKERAKAGTEALQAQAKRHNKRHRDQAKEMTVQYNGKGRNKAEEKDKLFQWLLNGLPGKLRSLMFVLHWTTCCSTILKKVIGSVQ